MDVKIECRGFKIDSFSIPPFLLKTGDFLNLRWPLPKGCVEEEQLERILKKKCVLPDIDISTPVHRAIPLPLKQRTFWRAYSKQKVKDKLIKSLKISETTAVNILEKLKLSKDLPITSLNFTERCLLGIEIAWYFSDTFLFDTAGLDPLGVKEIYEFVKEKLARNGAAIHISYPSLSMKPNSEVHVETIDINSTYEVLLRNFWGEKKG